jgi:hypothetical protein
MRACQDGMATSRAAVRRSSLSACGAAVALLAVAVSVWLPSSSSAMRQYSSDFGDRDPCAQAGVGDRGGTLTRTYMDKSRSDKPVSVLLQCSPVLSMRFGTLLADDVFLSGGRSFQGDMTARGWLNTKGHPFIHGDVSEALRLQSLQGAQTVVNALIAAGATLGGTLAVSGIVCAVGGIPTLGIACAGALGALGAAAVGALVSATSAVIKDLVATQVNRIKAMGNADWFVWSNTLVSWNSFGDITDTWVNPSLTNVNPNPFHRVQVRIGVQYSNAAAGGGPDFFSLPATSAPGAAAAAKQAGRRGRARRDLGRPRARSTLRPQRQRSSQRRPRPRRADRP